MAQAQKAIQHLTSKQLQQLGLSQSVAIALEDGEELTLEPEDVQVERKVKEGAAAGNSGDITLAFDLHLTEELLLEGLARELVNKINTMRRDMGLDVVDRICLEISTTDRMKHAFKVHQTYIEHEVLAVETLFKSCEGEPLDLNGEAATIVIKPV
jgi:isoleucyl-tRNA synthetase